MLWNAVPRRLENTRIRVIAAFAEGTEHAEENRPVVPTSQIRDVFEQYCARLERVDDDDEALPEIHSMISCIPLAIRDKAPDLRGGSTGKRLAGRPTSD